MNLKRLVMWVPNWLWLAWFASCFLPGCVGQSVKHLTDDNFEHDTQASTGQTTGIWAIRFCRDSCSETGAWKALAEELLQEHQILLADVDLASQTRLRKRFSPYISDDFDVFIIMLRRKKMYVNQDGLKNQDFESVRQWILSGWEMEEPKDVPDEASPIGELLEKIQMYLSNGKGTDFWTNPYGYILPLLCASLAILLYFLLRAHGQHNKTD